MPSWIALGALAVLLSGCRPLCDGVSQACIDIDLVGSGSFSALTADWQVADAMARSTRHGFIESPITLPRFLQTQSPPDVSPSSLRVLNLQADARPGCELFPDETSCERAATALLFNGEPLVDGSAGIPLHSGDRLSLSVKPFVFRIGSVEGLPATYTQALAADLDGDGQSEVMLTYSDNTVGLLRRGDSKMFTQYDRSLSIAPTLSIALGDWNSDGRTDLVLTSGNTLDIRKSRGDGTFEAPLTLQANWPIGPVAIGDFDGTPPAELVATEKVSCSPIASCRTSAYHYALWPNNQLTPREFVLPHIPTGTNPGYMHADFVVTMNATSDSLLDLVMLDDMTNTVLVAPGNATTPLATTSAWAALGALSICNLNPASLTGPQNDAFGALCDAPFGLAVFTHARIDQPTKFAGRYLGNLPDDQRKGASAVGDFNGDGRTDLALGDLNPSRTVTLMAGHADGTLSPFVTYEVSEPVTGIIAADLNGDGRSDLLVTHANSQRMSILYNYAR